MFDYRLSPKEIDLLSKICKKEMSIEELSQEISLSYSRTSELITRLKDKGFVTKTGNLKKSIKRAKTEHAQRFCQLTKTFPHIDWKDFLSHSKAEILTQICSSKQNIQQLSDITDKTERTIRDNLKKPKEIGLVKQKNDDFKITERFTPCCSFLRSWRYFYNLSLKDEIEPNASIVQQRGLEFLIESDSPIYNENFVETGPSLLSDLDDELIYTSYTYIYTKRGLALEEHLNNALRIEGDNERIKKSVKKIANQENISIDMKEVSP
ncbi:MAG: MarR family transcriptional regulator [Candidatus Thermoplasmatota archaeon]|nr:MarR family transcriptional regulator [Candidatus Thermoplasmatota archaeon]